MPILRTGACPPFIEYITKRALLPQVSTQTPAFTALTQYGFEWIDIPSYQRGLVWDDTLLEELLDSQSRFLGNAILGQFPIPQNRTGSFANVPASVTTYNILIDGLQRFSIGTSILSLLHGMVLANNPVKAAAAGYFEALRTHASPFAPVYLHNDTELKGHPRQAVRDSYVAFRSMLGNWLVRELDQDAPSIASKITHFFLERQIAPDTYHGFGSSGEIANTFIGLNTVRVQLNVVDWLRSVIIEKGERAGWPHGDIKDIENQFSEIFLSTKGTEPEAELVPFAAIIKDVLVEADSSPAPKLLFPSWGSGLLIAEVREFLSFIETLYSYKDNSFFREIRACGSIPFATCLCHYYRQFIQSGGLRPSFVQGGTNDDVDLQAFLRAVYRVLFDGRISRTRKHAEKLIRLPISNLTVLANELSSTFLGHDLNTSVDVSRLAASLQKADSKRAQRIFNACLLPLPNQTNFNPHLYGRGATEYQIDHLIPKSALDEYQPGEAEMNLLLNFAPIRACTNNAQSHIICSVKLSAAGSYPGEIANDPECHPYTAWLVQNQAHFGNQLDRQELLLPNTIGSWAPRRLQYLVDHLSQRL